MYAFVIVIAMHALATLVALMLPVVSMYAFLGDNNVIHNGVSTLSTVCMRMYTTFISGSLRQAISTIHTVTTAA